MWGKQLKRGTLIAATGAILLAMSASLSRAQPEAPSDAANMAYERAAPADDGPIGTQAAPSVSIAAPSAAIGDFGASQGNVWDMDRVTDIVWTQEPFPLQKLAGGTIVRGRIPEGEDLGIGFYTSPTTNLPSSQYHHLTYRLKIAAEGNCLTNGRILYAKAWPNWLGHQVYSHGFLPHSWPMNCPPGEWCIYYMDLSSNSNDIAGADTATWFTDPPPWPTDGVKAFGMWPHERWGPGCSGGPDFFDIDYVYLTGDVVAREKDGYTYTLKWNVSDPDGGTITSILRYKEVPELLLPSESPTCDSSNFETEWTYIGQKTTDLSPGPSYPNKIYLPIILGGASGGMGPFNETYEWDLSGPEFGDGLSYYVCIEVDDGTSQSYEVSSAPVIRVPHSPNFGNE
jgi:hypothetical protein